MSFVTRVVFLDLITSLYALLSLAHKWVRLFVVPIHPRGRSVTRTRPQMGSFIYPTTPSREQESPKTETSVTAVRLDWLRFAKMPSSRPASPTRIGKDRHICHSAAAQIGFFRK